VGWLSDITGIFKRDHVNEFKALTAELKELKQYWKERFKEREARLQELEAEIARMQERETEYHEELIRMTQAYRDVHEELIFLRLMNKK